MRPFALALISLLLLSACAPAAAPTPSATPAAATASATHTATQPPTATATPQPSPTPFAGVTIPDELRDLPPFDAENVAGIYELASLEIGVDIGDIAFVPEDGGYSLWVATWEQQSRLEHWDLYASAPLRELAVGAIFAPRSLSASADGSLLVTADENDVQLFDPDTGELDFDFEDSPWLVEAALSPTDPDLLALGYDSVDGTVVLIDLSSGEELGIFRHGDYVTDLDFLSNGRYLASAAANGSAKVIALDEMAETFPYEEIGLVDSLALEAAPDGAGLPGALLATSADGEIALWDAARGELYSLLNGHQVQVLSMDLSPNGQLLASGDHDGTLNLWDVVTGEEVASYLLPGGQVRRVLFSADGSLLAAATLEGPVWVWAAGN